MLYDIDILLKDLNLTNEEKENIIKELREEFPQDDLLFELHLYRMIQFLKKERLNK